MIFNTPLLPIGARIGERCLMHIISRRKLQNFWKVYPRAERPLDAWYKRARCAEWESLNDVKSIYPRADPYGSLVIFDIGGNKFRLIVAIHYNRRKIFVRHVLTHEEYTRGDWKKE